MPAFLSGGAHMGTCTRHTQPFTSRRPSVPVAHSICSASRQALMPSDADSYLLNVPDCSGHAPQPPSARSSSSSHHAGRQPARRVACRALNIGDLQLDMPEIDGDIRSLQDDGIAITFGKKRQALEALSSGVVLCDQSHWGRLRVAGEDRLALMHNQSTADLKAVAPGQSTTTVFVTATGRCIELATAVVTPGAVLLLVSPDPVKSTLLQRLNKYIFPADKVTVTDVSSKTAQIALLGPEAEVVLRELAPKESLSALGSAPGSHVLLGFQGKPLFVVRSSGLGPATPGFTLIVDESVAGDVYAALAGKGAVPMGSDDWEAARILAGRPAPGKELTEQYNPLEAGLYGAVSLNKGCYIGQETLAKLHLRDGVKQQLWGLRLGGPVEPGADINSELDKVGVVTSVCQDGEGEWVGLGYIRCRLSGAQLDLEGVRVAVAGMPATVTAVSHATRRLAASSEPQQARAMPSGAGAGADGAEGDGATILDRLEEAKRIKAEQAAQKQAATDAKLKAMQERLAAWQQQQQQS